MKAWSLGVVAFVSVLLVERTASACTCLPPEVGRSYQHADHVVHVRVYGPASESEFERLYFARLLDDDFKGCLSAGSWIVVRTASSSAACGIGLRSGREYLLYGRSEDDWRGLEAMRVGLCDANARWESVAADDLAYLQSRYVCCGGECACTDGSQPVNCLVDPCSVSSCDVEDADCLANYCGGCNAEWYDESGALVCDDGA